MTPPAKSARERDPDAYEAGLRAGYAHGYDIGHAHARRDLDSDPELGTDLELTRDADVARAVRLDGPDRAELIARGHIPIDHTRPPALPVRLWDAVDWAKAESRDLPTTEHGHAQWRKALAAGHVPQHLADAHAAAHPQQAAGNERGRAGSAAELAEHVSREVVEAGRAAQAARNQVERTRTVPSVPERDEYLTRPRGADVAETERGISR